jgi:WD40 repeat protein/serine/threonine protein kinase
MSEPILSPESLPSLRALLARAGDLSLDETLAFLQQLVHVVQSLHAAGQVHRGISVETVLLDDTSRVVLAQAEPLRMLNGADLDTSPPELQSARTLRLPIQIDDCRRALEDAGVRLDPRRIDVYQIGVVLCRLLTQTTVAAYLRSPRVKSGVPPRVRPLLERALGYQAAKRLADAGQLAAMLGEVLDQEPVDVMPATPLPEGSLSRNPECSSSDTPVSDLSLPSRIPEVEEAAPALERLGPYRIVEPLGRGGMGDVYLGYEDKLQRKVAIKVLPAKLARNPKLVERFHAEATALAQLHHPNIVPIYSIGEAAGYHYFAMHYVEGESLERQLEQRGSLEVSETIAILEQCLAGLAAVHQAGLVHRDIKPGNILLDRKSERALLADFGLVKWRQREGSPTSAGVIVGTVDYLAPEQARARKVDRRADLYALGVVAYRMLSGRLPFDAEIPGAMIAGHALQTPRSLSAFKPELPGALTALVDKLLAVDPDARYQTCDDVLAELRGLKLRSPWADQRPRQPRRLRSLVVCGLILVGAGGGFALFASKQLFRDRNPRKADPAEEGSKLIASESKDSVADPPLARVVLPPAEEVRAPYVPPGSVVDAPAQRTTAPAQKQNLPLVINKEQQRWVVPQASRVNSLAVSADGRQFLTASGDRIVRLWNLDSETPAGQFDTQGRMVFGLAFSPDGKQALCGGERGMLVLWNLQTQKVDVTFEGHSALITSVAFSPDGSRVLSSSTDPGAWLDSTVRYWDRINGRDLNRFNAQRRQVNKALFLPNGRQVLFGTGAGAETRLATARLWDLETGNISARFETEDFGFGGLSLAGDGQRALTPAYPSGTQSLFVWEAQSGRVLRRIELPGLAGHGAVLSGNGQYVLTGGGGFQGSTHLECFIHLYDVQSCREICRFGGHTGSVQHVCFAPGERTIFSGADDGTVRLWELPILPRNLPFGKGEVCCFQGHTAAVTSVAFSPDGLRVLSGSLDGTARLWDLTSGLEVRRFEGHGEAVRAVAFTPGGHHVLAAGDDRAVRLWSVANGKELRMIPQPAEVTCLACSPDGRAVLAGAMDKNLRLFDLDTARELQGFYGHPASIRACAFSPDGRWVVSLGEGGTRLWDVQTGQERKWGTPQAGGTAVLAPNGFRCLAVENLGMRVLSADDVLKLKDWRPGGAPSYQLPVTPPVLSPDGRWLVVGSGSNVELSSTAGPKGWRTFRGHKAQVTSVALAPFGLLAVSGGADLTVRVWGLGD